MILSQVIVNYYLVWIAFPKAKRAHSLKTDKATPHRQGQPKCVNASAVF